MDVILGIVRAIAMIGFVAIVIALLAGLFMIVFEAGTSIGRRDRS